MKCCSCGGEIRDDARFCTLCGAKQAEPAPVAAPIAEPAFIPAEPAFVPAEPAFVPAEQEAAPAAEPAFIPAFEPAPVAEAAPAPAYEPAPAPAAEPAPAPQPQPQYVPQSQPQYEYVPQPQPQPQPVPVVAPVATAQPAFQSVYQAPAAAVAHGPAYQLPDRRGMWKMLLLGLVTGGIYNMVIMSRIAEEINMVASKHDGKRTQQYFWASMLTALTLGIYAFVWIHGLCNRIGDELKRRGINYKFGAADFWIWNFLVGVLCGIALAVTVAIMAKTAAGTAVIWLVYVAGAILTAVGPFIYTYKLCKATNLMNRDYNING